VKKALLDMLRCPSCLPEEHLLRSAMIEFSREDILEGTLKCEDCGASYRILDGIAFLDPNRAEENIAGNRYETLPVLSSYLWSHYGDLLEDQLATDAYRQWADLMYPCTGILLDTGSAVGRFSFEMARKCDFVIGIDNSVSFIRAARELMIHRAANFSLLQEGLLSEEKRLTLPEDWKTENVEFIVGDVLALPFRSGLFSAVSSLNVIDKVLKPIIHMTEINRSARKNDAQFLFSDPFSWSTAAAPEEDWLGGTVRGSFPGRGKENILALLEGEKGILVPRWKVETHGHVWWKIRTHSNHFELIRSCFVKALR
jgi:SAM-dependent methyltransferase